jgi:hypothetical protein
MATQLSWPARRAQVWSKLDTTWTGVSIDTPLSALDVGGDFVLRTCGWEGVVARNGWLGRVGFGPERRLRPCSALSGASTAEPSELWSRG